MRATDELDEPILPNSYPVYGDYLYVVDGKVTRSDVFGNVHDLKRNTGGKEVRRCDIVGRMSETAYANATAPGEPL